MAKKTVLFKSKEKKDLGGVSAFLHQLADKLAQNQVTFRRGEDEVVIDVPDYVTLKVKVDAKDKRRKKKHSLKIKIDWREGDTSGGTITLG